MSLIGWSKKFENYEKVDIVPRVKRTEALYWIWLLVGIVMVIGGAMVMTWSLRYSLGGFLLVISGVISIALIKIWAHIRLATYQIILELRLRDRE